MWIINIIESPIRMVVDSLIKSWKTTSWIARGGAWIRLANSFVWNKKKRKPLSWYGKDYPNYTQTFFDSTKFDSSKFKGLSSKKKTIFDIR